MADHNDVGSSDHPIDRLVTGMCKGLRDNKITMIRLNQRSFADKHADALAQALAQNTSLKKLDIRGPAIVGIAGIQSLSLALKRHPSIERLGLDEIEVTDEGAVAIASIVELSESLETLGLEGTSIGQMGWIALANALERNSTLRVINLSRNKLVNSHVDNIALAIDRNKTCRLECLILSNNNIGDEGVEKLAQALTQKTFLKMLALPENQFSLSGLKALEKMMSINCHLKRMYLYGNRYPYSSTEKQHISYLLELNEAGRAEMRDESCRSLCPHVLERVNKQPTLMYGLLSELPHMWSPPPST